MSHFIPFGRKIISLYDDSLTAKDEVLKNRRLNAFNAAMHKLINEDKLSEDDVQSLIDKDNISLITDLHMQAMQTQSPKLQIALGLIYAEYIKNTDNKAEQAQYRRMFNAVKQLTEQDLDVFYHVVKYQIRLSNINGTRYLLLSLGMSDDKIFKYTKKVINKSMCDGWDDLKTTMHHLVNIGVFANNLHFAPHREGTSQIEDSRYNESIKFGITQFSEKFWNLCAQAQEYHTNLETVASELA